MVREERNSRQEPMQDREVRDLLGQVSKVVIARGKKLNESKSEDVSLDDLRGPTGSFRAPMIRKGKTLLVGFSPDALGALI